MNKFPEFWRHRCTTLITGSITGLPGYPVRGVTLRNVTMTYGGIGDGPKPDHLRSESLAKVPECETNYPESKMFGILPAWGLYCRHANGIVMENVSLRVTGKDYRPAIVCDDVSNLTMNGVRILSGGSGPAVVLNDVRDATISNSSAPQNPDRFLEKLGTTSGVKGP